MARKPPKPRTQRAVMVFEFEWPVGSHPNLAPSLVIAAVENLCKGVKITHFAVPDMRELHPKPVAQVTVYCTNDDEGENHRRSFNAPRASVWPIRCPDCGQDAAPKSVLRAMRRWKERI